MRIEYADEAVRALIEDGASDDRRYRKLRSNAAFHRDLRKVMAVLRSVVQTTELHAYRTLSYEALKHGLSGRSSVRIGFTSKYRLIFEEKDGGIRILVIEVSEHYGDK